MSEIVDASSWEFYEEDGDGRGDCLYIEWECPNCGEMNDRFIKHMEEKIDWDGYSITDKCWSCGKLFGVFEP